MLQVHFILLGEGSSDRALVEPLRRLCVAEGAGEVTGDPRGLSLAFAEGWVRELDT